MERLTFQNDCLPLLTSRGLTLHELAALRTQGFVSSEHRGKKIIYKLRYRIDGRQLVRCLGDDVLTAKGIEEELAVLQNEARSIRHRAELHGKLRTVLRESKLTLKPLLEARGFRFHGHTIRQSRRHDQT